MSTDDGNYVSAFYTVLIFGIIGLVLGGPIGCVVGVIIGLLVAILIAVEKVFNILNEKNQS